MEVLWPNGSRTAPRLGGGYGPRESFWTPGGWTNSFHYGQDCTGFTMNRSIAPGVVTYVGYNGGYGNYVRVRHEDGYSSGYAHGATGGFQVSVGQRVYAGTALCVQGTTGRSTGVHLHFEVYDRNGNTIDPAEYVRTRIAGAAPAGDSSPDQSEEDDMYDDAAKADAKDRHDELMKALGKIHQAAAPYIQYRWGTGILAVNRRNGRYWIIPEAYPELLNELQLTAGQPVEINTDKLGFVTGFLPAAIGDKDFDPSTVDGLGAENLAAIKDAIAQSAVAVTADQLKKLTEAVGAAARTGGEQGAVKAIKDLTFVVSAA